jgi:hypothetical protein
MPVLGSFVYCISETSSLLDGAGTWQEPHPKNSTTNSKDNTFFILGSFSIPVIYFLEPGDPKDFGREMKINRSQL